MKKILRVSSLSVYLDLHRDIQGRFAEAPLDAVDDQIHVKVTVDEHRVVARTVTVAAKRGRENCERDDRLVQHPDVSRVKHQRHGGQAAAEDDGSHGLLRAAVLQHRGQQSASFGPEEKHKLK